MSAQTALQSADPAAKEYQTKFAYSRFFPAKEQ